jgi:hypothetical protein
MQRFEEWLQARKRPAAPPAPDTATHAAGVE